MKHEVKQVVGKRTVVMQANMKRRAAKLHHPTLRNCTYTFIDEDVVYGGKDPQPYACPKCGVPHVFKTYHLDFDANGDFTIHQDLYEFLKMKGLLEELVATKEVIPRPHAIGLGGIGLNGDVPTQAAQVISRETGPIQRLMPILILNAVQPGNGFRQEPDGTWTDLDKES